MDAATHSLRLTGSPRASRSGARVNHRHLTAAKIDSGSFLAAKRRADTNVLVPKGTKIAFAGGREGQGHGDISDTVAHEVRRLGLAALLWVFLPSILCQSSSP
ncbi:MAG: hypothetical protein AAF264_09065 [Pseudomonadota bacterium]